MKEVSIEELAKQMVSLVSASQVKARKNGNGATTFSTPQTQIVIPRAPSRLISSQTLVNE